MSLAASDYGRGKRSKGSAGSGKSREAEKLNLEIESLRQKNRRDLVRLITTVVTVVGLLLALAKFSDEREKERLTREADQKLRFQSQMRADIDEILRFPQDKSQTISRATFLLEDLKALLGLAPVTQDEQTFGTYKAALTRSLVYLITYDTDFLNSPRDVRFAATVAENWDDYGKHLKSHPAELNLILYKHVRAVRYLRDTNPNYLEDVKYYEPTNQYFVLPKYEKQEGEESRFQHFIHIRNGFRTLIKLIGKDESAAAKQIRNQSLRDFEAALCNPDVARQVLGEYFAGVPCEK